VKLSEKIGLAWQNLQIDEEWHVASCSDCYHALAECIVRNHDQSTAL